MTPNRRRVAEPCVSDDPLRSVGRRDLVVDAWLAVALLLVALLTTALASVILSSAGNDMPSPIESLIGLAAVTLPLALRRRFPVAVLVVVSTAFIVVGVRGHPDDLVPSIAEFVAVFSANVWSPSRRRSLVASLLVVAGMFVWLGVDIAGQVRASSDPADVVLAASLYSVVLNALFFVAAIHFGRVSRVSRARLRALEQTGAALRAANDRIAEQAIDDERARIARELHDVVAHHVAVIGIQAGAARRTLDRPEIARGALAAVEETARTTIDELDRLLSVMRSRDGRPTEPVVGLASLPDLVADTRGLGLEVALEIDGDTRDIPDGVGATLYRVAQEALTNTLKHGAASTATVRLVHGDRAVVLEIDDDGHGDVAAAAEPVTAAGSGLGHRGMRERVDLHGGRLAVGPLPGGGYRVRVDLPVVPRGTTLVEGE
jgi:signal transduction histidine kinase